MAYTQKKGGQFVAEHIGENVSTLVENAFKASFEDGTLLDWQSFTNIYNEETDEYFEPLEYWLVSDWLAELLDKYEEVVSYKSDNHLNLNIWGRCMSGQRIAVDDIIQEIINDLDL